MMFLGRRTPEAAAKRVLADSRKMVALHATLPNWQQKHFVATHVHKCLLLLTITTKAVDGDSAHMSNVVQGALAAAGVDPSEPETKVGEDGFKALMSVSLAVSSDAFLRLLRISGCVAYVAGYNINEPAFLRKLIDRAIEGV